MKIAVDAMGGDYAPEAIVEGAVQAAEEYGSSIILVGQKDLVDKELEKYETTHLDIEIRHASQIVDMHDQPSLALRRKKDSSLHVAISLTRDGYADAAVSAGNTGAGMAIGKVLCRMPEGIDRPAIATVMPNVDGLTVVIDVGANVDCKPIHLLQFAVMGYVYAKELLKIDNPRIGLLSIGEESTKGNVLTKEVFEPLSISNLNFIGNAEGRDVFNGRVDVVVCDGFIGNVVLKVSESLAKMMKSLLEEGFSRNWRTKLGYLLAKPGLDGLKKRTDYSEYGGAPLLGLNRVVIISHGSSKARAIKNAIRVASESVELQIQEKIAETMEQCEFDVKSRKRATSFWRRFRSSARHEGDKEKPPPEKHEAIEQQEQPQKAEQPGELEQQEPIQEQQEQQESVQEQQEQQEQQEPIQEQQEQEELEHEKRSWWHLKDSKHQNRSKSEKHEVPEQDEQIQKQEPPSEPDQQQNPALRQERPHEPEHEKRRWWRRHRDTGKLDRHEEAETQEPIQEPESESDQHHEAVIVQEEQLNTSEKSKVKS